MQFMCMEIYYINAQPFFFTKVNLSRCIQCKYACIEQRKRIGESWTQVRLVHKTLFARVEHPRKFLDVTYARSVIFRRMYVCT